MKNQTPSFLITFLGGIFYICALFFLLFDSHGNYSSSIKYLGVDSRYVYNVFMLLQIAFSILNVGLLPQKLISLNNKFVFPVSAAVFIILAIINGFTYQYFVFNTFYVNLENLKYVPFISGVVLLANMKAAWLDTAFKRSLFLGGVVFLIVMNFLSFLAPEVFKSLIKEDGAFENLQTLLYFCAAIFALLAGIKFYKSGKTLPCLFFSVLALGFFFVSGEEIAWGQRIFNIQTPQQLKDINLQHELTIHNIGAFQSKIDYIYMLIGLIGAFSGLLAKKFAPKFYKKNAVIFPPVILIFYFIAVARYYFLNQFVVFSYQLFTFEKFGIGDRQEISETLLAFGFACFAVMAYKGFNNAKN